VFQAGCRDQSARGDFRAAFLDGGMEALGVSGGEEVLGHLQLRGFVEAQQESRFQDDTEWSFHQNLLEEVIIVWFISILWMPCNCGWIC